MSLSELIVMAKQKPVDGSRIASAVQHQSEVLSEILDGLLSDKGTLKFGCEKLLRIISEYKPVLLYPHLSLFSDNLQSENTFIRCGAMVVIANLAVIDHDKKIDAYLDDYYNAIPGPALIPAGTAIKGSATIAKAKPYLTDRIVDEILKVEHASYQTTECRNIACGHAISALSEIFDQASDKEKIICFAKHQVGNSRTGTANKAVKFLKKFDTK
ncbi:hypothetical protein JW960_17795 [candidate division KSB1 bacterium]|nr:hypothetical protein [candidate division KSB1 bacterium]